MSGRCFLPLPSGMMAEQPFLYSFRRCPYAMRARLALAVSGIAHEVREVKLRNKPAAMLAASPKGTVPVLVLPDSRVIDESIDIMRWALASNDPEGWLDGDDRELIAANDRPFKLHLDRYKYPDRFVADGVDHRAAGVMMLEVLERRLIGAAYLCGDRRMLADAAIMPFVRQFAAVDRAWFEGLALPGVKKWLAGWLESELFEAVMARREIWVPG